MFDLGFGACVLGSYSSTRVLVVVRLLLALYSASISLVPAIKVLIEVIALLVLQVLLGGYSSTRVLVAVRLLLALKVLVPV